MIRDEEEIYKAILGTTDLGVSAADSTDGEAEKRSWKVNETPGQNSTSITCSWKPGANDLSFCSASVI